MEEVFDIVGHGSSVNMVRWQHKIDFWLYWTTPFPHCSTLNYMYAMVFLFCFVFLSPRTHCTFTSSTHSTASAPQPSPSPPPRHWNGWPAGLYPPPRSPQSSINNYHPMPLGASNYSSAVSAAPPHLAVRSYTACCCPMVCC